MRMVHRRCGAPSLGDIERVYRSRYDEYRRVATAIVGDTERARDAVQEAFASAVRKRDAFRGEGPLEAWIWRAVVNAALNQLRSTLRLLPERQRLALFLRYYADLDYATIATVLRISEGTVAATLHAA